MGFKIRYGGVGRVARIEPMQSLHAVGPDVYCSASGVGFEECI